MTYQEKSVLYGTLFEEHPSKESFDCNEKNCQKLWKNFGNAILASLSVPASRIKKN